VIKQFLTNLLVLGTRRWMDQVGFRSMPRPVCRLIHCWPTRPKRSG